MLFHSTDGGPVMVRLANAHFVGRVSISYEGAGIACLEVVNDGESLIAEYFCTACKKVVPVPEIFLYCIECGRLKSSLEMIKPDIPGTFICDECIKLEFPNKRFRKVADLLLNLSITQQRR